MRRFVHEVIDVATLLSTLFVFIRRFNNARKDDDMFAEDFVEKHTVVLVNDILCSPGRQSRPAKIVIIMRGPPGSGKTYTAKLIKVSFVNSCVSFVFLFLYGCEASDDSSVHVRKD